MVNHMIITKSQWCFVATTSSSVMDCLTPCSRFQPGLLERPYRLYNVNEGIHTMIVCKISGLCFDRINTIRLQLQRSFKQSLSLGTRVRVRGSSWDPTMDVAGFPNGFCISLGYHAFVGLATIDQIHSLMIFSVHVMSIVSILSKYTDSIKVSNQIKSLLSALQLQKKQPIQHAFSHTECT